MPYAKPRLTLALLLAASVVGVYLAWSPTSVSVVVPGVSWVVIVALGTVLGSSLLWLVSATHVADWSTPWVARRWSLLSRIAVGGALVGVALRLLAAPGRPTTGSGLLLLCTGAALSILFVIHDGAIGDRESQSRALVGTAIVGFVGIGWGDVAVQGGATVDVVVRTLHLWAVGVWIGAAVWHNAVVVPALKRDAITDIHPVVRRFQRFVPGLVLVVLVTGAYQATTWLGTRPTVYTTTGAGQLTVLKLTLLVVIGGLIGVTHLRTPVTEPE